MILSICRHSFTPPGPSVYSPEFQLRGEFLTSVRGPRSAERSSEEVRVRGGLGPRSEVRARSELGPSAEVMASVRATRSPRSEDQAKKLETAGRRSMKGAPSPHSPLVRFTARIHSHASMPQTIAHHSEHFFSDRLALICGALGPRAPRSEVHGALGPRSEGQPDAVRARSEAEAESTSEGPREVRGGPRSEGRYLGVSSLVRIRLLRARTWKLTPKL